MNEKFWDLDKAKQDRMINGALKVFACNGFRHASTDEIVTEASVSKGLLFHYFLSKNGLYEFLTEYCARFALVELNSEIRKTEVLPFFDLQGKMTRAECRIMRQYPYLLLFLDTARRDRSFAGQEEIHTNISLFYDRVVCLLKKSLLPDTMDPEDAHRVSRLLDLAKICIASSILEQGAFSPDKYSADMADYIRMFERLYKTY